MKGIQNTDPYIESRVNISGPVARLGQGEICHCRCLFCGKGEYRGSCDSWIDRVCHNDYLFFSNRIGNGDEASGDGWRYRGRGFIQLTGRANYRSIGQRIGLDLEGNPDQVASDPVIALQVAANYWDSRNLNEVADTDDIYKVTRLINGGLNGIDDRKKLLGVAKSIWGG